MNIENYKNLVLPVFKGRYPTLENPQLTDVITDVFGGTMVVVKSDTKVEHEEVVFIDDRNNVIIFSTTEHLASFLDQRSKMSLFDKVMSRGVLSGLIFCGLLWVLALLGFEQHYSDKVMTILGGVTTLAAGYFFGASGEKSRS